MKIKLHIARIFCLFTILLVGSNIAISASATLTDDFVVSSELPKELSKYTHTVFKKGVDQSANGLNLVKNPTEAVLMYYYIGKSQPSLVYFYESVLNKVRKDVFHYSPLIKALPLWIQNLQIRI